VRLWRHNQSVDRCRGNGNAGNYCYDDCHDDCYVYYDYYDCYYCYDCYDCDCYACDDCSDRCDGNSRHQQSYNGDSRKYKYDGHCHFACDLVWIFCCRKQFRPSCHHLSNCGRANCDFILRRPRLRDFPSHARTRQ
jgi:hypothetical protein